MLQYVLAKSVTGDCLDTLGTLPISIRVGDRCFSHDVQVVRNATQPLILGWDFLQKHRQEGEGSVIDLTSNQLKLWDRPVSLLCSPQIAPLRCSAVMLLPVTIPALIQMNVLIKIQSNTSDPEHSPNYTGILEPGVQNMPSLLVACTLTTVKRGMACIQVMNPSSEDCHVPGDIILGDFHSVANQSGKEFSLVEATVANVKAQPVTFPKVDLSQAALDAEH